MLMLSVMMKMALVVFYQVVVRVSCMIYKSLNTPENCQELMIGGVKVLVPNMASHLLDGIEIDYEDKLMGGGFKINNPNAKSSCGCGESFA